MINLILSIFWQYQFKIRTPTCCIARQLPGAHTNAICCDIATNATGDHCGFYCIGGGCWSNGARDGGAPNCSVTPRAITATRDRNHSRCGSNQFETPVNQDDTDPANCSDPLFRRRKSWLVTRGQHKTRGVSHCRRVPALSPPLSIPHRYRDDTRMPNGPIDRVWTQGGSSALAQIILRKSKFQTLERSLRNARARNPKS